MKFPGFPNDTTWDLLGNTVPKEKTANALRSFRDEYISLTDSASSASVIDDRVLLKRFMISVMTLESKDRSSWLFTKSRAS